MKPLSGRCILAIDADAGSASRWREWLPAYGGRVICSASLESAIANALTFPGGTFDAVLAVHCRSNLDAAELADVLRALPRTSDLPLLVVVDPPDMICLQSRIPPPHAVVPGTLSAEEIALRLCRMFASVRTPGSRLPAAAAEGCRGSVLVAEDDPVNAEMMRTMLVQLGYSVKVVGNGEEAVACAANGTFDAMLMDGQMPGMDGLEATRVIREEEARRGVRHPIIGVTATTLEQYREQCIHAGMDDVVHKPVRITGLLRVLSRWFPPVASAAAPPSNVMTFTPRVSRTEALAVPAQDDTIDWSQIDSLRLIDPQGKTGIVGRAIGLYMDNGPKLIEQIRGFRTGADLKDVRRAAHSLKSSSASLGAMIVAGLSRTIEQAAADGDRQVIDSTVTPLESAFRRAASALRGVVSRGGSV